MTAPSDLARQLVEHPRWAAANKAGMWTVSGWIHAEPGMIFDFVSPVSGATRIASEESRLHGDLPWIEHPATIGWMMAEIWKRNHKAHTYCNAGVWSVLFTDAEGEKPGAALAAALLAVWGGAS